MQIFVTGISYRTAPVEVRERLAINPDRVVELARRIQAQAGLSEVVLLSTCNRVEIYAAAERIPGGAETLFRWLTPFYAELEPYFYSYEGEEAVRHLLQVASGIDSMVVGETQITGQVKQAYQRAQQAGLTGRTLNLAFQKAFRTVKAVRTQTRLGCGSISVGSVAVDLAAKIFGEAFQNATVLIVGAGRMGELCVRHLAKKGAQSVLVTNRSFDKARALAQAIGGQAVPFDQFEQAVAQSDIVVGSAGCPYHLLDRAKLQRLMPARRHRPLVLIDIAVPRIFHDDVNELENVYLYNVDDLQQLVAANRRQREQELAQCRALIEEHTAEVMAKLAERPPVVRQPAQPAWWAAGLATCSH